jgi:2-oxo-3-hexenedioate decarboxylase
LRAARLALLGVALAALPAGAAAPESDAYTTEYMAAAQAVRPFRPVTSFVPDINLDQAYAIQHRIVERQLAGGDRIAGYRGGLMSQTSMRQRGVTQPLVAVQFRSGRRTSPATLSFVGYRHAALEVKLGFIFGRDLPSGPLTPETVRAAVRSVVPVIDLPDIGYADPAHYSAMDMVAANISSARFVIGKPIRCCADLDQESATLAYDGKALTHGLGRDSLGDALASLVTVVQLARAQGYRIRRGDIVLTGKIGDKVDVQPGSYTAHFGTLGDVHLMVGAR